MNNVILDSLGQDSGGEGRHKKEVYEASSYTSTGISNVLTVFLTVLFVYAVFLAFISSVSTCSLNASRSFSALSLAPFSSQLST